MLTLRPYKQQDASTLLGLFRDTIRRVNCRDYAPQQIDAWAHRNLDVAAWAERFAGRCAYVAEMNHIAAGFADLSPDGYLDRLFVSADHQRRGVATALLNRLLQDARAAAIGVIFTNASITARPFFESQGFRVEARQSVECRGVLLENFRMTLSLQSRLAVPEDLRRTHRPPRNLKGNNMLQGIHHAAIICSRYEQSREFYVDVLGLRVIAENFRAERDSWKLDLALPDGSQVELFSFPNAGPRPNYPEAQGLRHLAFRVQDLDACVEQLESAGIAMEEIRTDEYTGQRFVFFRDPDDLPLELYECT